MLSLNNCFSAIKKVQLATGDALVHYKHKKNAIDFTQGPPPSKKALVFGNGPSLAGFLNAHEKNLIDNDVYVCNGFSLTPYYESIRPSQYCLLDSLYFDLEDERVKNKSVPVIAIWENLFKNTSWPLTLYTALEDTSVLNTIKDGRFGSNDNITWVNIAPVKFESENKNKLYATGIGLVGGMTVVHLSVQIALLRKHQEVYLCGVDHDWIENIRYEDSTNKVYLQEKHFYDTTKLYYGEGVFKNITLLEEFYAFYNTLSDFKKLMDFAAYQNVQVFRATKSFVHFIPFKEFCAGK